MKTLRAKPVNRIPEIVERYRASVTFRRAADTLGELVAVGMSEHDLRDAVRMAMEIDSWSTLDRMRLVHGDDAVPKDGEYRNGLVLPVADCPSYVTFCLANFPTLWAKREDSAARVELRKSLALLKEYYRS